MYSVFVFVINDGIPFRRQDWILLVILPAEVIIPQPQPREQASGLGRECCNKGLKYHSKFFTLYLSLSLITQGPNLWPFGYLENWSQMEVMNQVSELYCHSLTGTGV